MIEVEVEVEIVVEVEVEVEVEPPSVEVDIEAERAGEAEEVADIADDAGVTMDDVDAAIEQGVEDATSDLSDEVASEIGDEREEVLGNWQTAKDADNEELDDKVAEAMEKIAGDLGILHPYECYLIKILDSFDLGAVLAATFKTRVRYEVFVVIGSS